MSNPFFVPQTPPRTRLNNNKVSLDTNQQNQNQLHKQFNNYETPNRMNNNKSFLLTPSTVTKNKKPTFESTSSSLQSRRKSNTDTNKQYPFTPKTPQKSPTKSSNLHHPQQHQQHHHIYSRKRNLNDIFLAPPTSQSSSTTTTTPNNKYSNLSTFNNNEKISFGLFLPSPSTIGKGRNYKNLSLISNNSSIIFDKKKIEELKNQKDNNNDINGINEEMDIEINEDISHEPTTPKKQLIDDIKIKQWHGKSFNNKFNDESDEEEEEEEEEEVKIMKFEDIKNIPKVKMTNPFLDNDKPTIEYKNKTNKNIFDSNDKINNINYNTHMELINNKTGEKKIIKLNKNQMKYKPKKLSFEEFK
ncbi:hypothetical protein KGF54_002538 [Candida jiufengensis]|uniref:uncharacterized protein n=1 Tax=Candida jiufengensis TaxID=497108 RepID=UPI00222481CE|nr:uncharacterized protein KGF54_002538 [Candida jiufengensis]KAI5953167.1 hypothetical protein KGF54_002538 [Candida jiufengensis]